MAGRLDPAIDVLIVAAAAEPRRAQAAVTVLQPERVHLIPLHEVGRLLILAIERLATPQPGFYRQAQARQAMRAAARRPANRLGQFLAHQPREIPFQALVVYPLVVQICVVLQGDQLECEFDSWDNTSSSRLRSNPDGELVIADVNRIVGRNVALGQHRQELPQMPLQSDAVLGPQFARRSYIQQRLPLARLVVAKPTDTRYQFAIRAAVMNAAVHAVREHSVHRFPRIVIAAVQCLAVVTLEHGANAGSQANICRDSGGRSFTGNDVLRR